MKENNALLELVDELARSTEQSAALLSLLTTILCNHEAIDMPIGGALDGIALLTHSTVARLSDASRALSDYYSRYLEPGKR